MKENNDSNKTYRYVNDISLHQINLPKCNGSQVVSIKQNMNLNIQPPAMLVLMAFYKCASIWICSSVQVLYPSQKSECPLFWNDWNYGNKISYDVNASVNGMTPTEFPENLVIGWKLIEMGQITDRRDMMSQVYFIRLGRKVV
jgi:hypothetical protein